MPQSISSPAPLPTPKCAHREHSTADGMRPEHGGRGNCDPVLWFFFLLLFLVGCLMDLISCRRGSWHFSLLRGICFDAQLHDLPPNSTGAWLWEVAAMRWASACPPGLQGVLVTRVPYLSTCPFLPKLTIRNGGFILHCQNKPIYLHPCLMGCK